MKIDNRDGECRRRYIETRRAAGRAAYILGLALICARGANAQDVFINGSTYKNFYLTNVPDFDQKRTYATEMIGGVNYMVDGLANNGNEYCVPTSAVNWVSFLANRGWNGLAPGPGTWSGSWTGGLSGLDEYNTVDGALWVMGVLMHTDPFKGSGGPWVRNGLQAYMDAFYPGELCITHVLTKANQFPRMSQLLQASLEGRLVETVGGWYHTTTLNNVTFYYRAGGHACSLAQAVWHKATPGYQIGLCNPANGDSDETVQSPFAYTPYTTTSATLNFTKVYAGTTTPIPGTQYVASVDFIDKAKNWILDGDVVIQPMQGYTIEANKLVQITPTPLLANGLLQQVETITAGDSSTITSECSDAVTGTIYYTTSQSPNRLFTADPLTGISSSVTLQVQPRQLLGGGELLPYLLFDQGSIGQVDPATGTVTNVHSLGTVDRIVYCQAGNLVCAIDWGDKVATFINGAGQRVAQITLPAVQDTTHAAIQAGDNGNLFLMQNGSQYVDQLYLNANGQTVTIQHLIPVAAHSTWFDIDSQYRLYFVYNGQLLVSNLQGSRVITGFSGRQVGTRFRISRGSTNFDPLIHNDWEWYDVPPSG